MKCPWCNYNEFVVQFSEGGKLTKIFCGNCEMELDVEEMEYLLEKIRDEIRARA